MSTLRLQPIADWPQMAAVVLLLLVLLCVLPRHGNLSRRKLATLIGLRLLVVLMTLFAMLRPTLVTTQQKPVPASLVLLVDGSRSMQVEDSLGDASRWRSMKSLLDAAAGDLAKLADIWQVNAYAFDAETHKIPVDKGTLSLADSPDGEQSALGAAIHEALDREASGRVLAMLVLSDGAQRALAPRDLPPQVAVRRLAAENIPLFTFTFGKPGGSERADLSIGDLVTNETLFTDAPTEVRGRITAVGYANQPVKAQLLWESADGMQPVDTISVDTGMEGGSLPVVLRHTPQTPGEYKVSLRVEPRDGELVTTNNEVSTFVTVRTGGINVLYLVGAKRVGGGPGQEQRFARAALAQSPDVVVERRLFNYQPTNVDLSEAIRDGKYDVVILDDVDAQALTIASWQALADRVRNGTGLMMLGGYHSFGPGGFRDSPLADVLPINIGPAQRQNFGEPLREDVHLAGPVPMRLSAPLGTRHPIMQLGGNTATAWLELPPLDGANSIAQDELKPNAQVLAEADDAQRHPLLVAGQSGNGRTLAFAGDSTWRWPMQGFGDAHRRFWRQCVLWLAKKDEQTEGRVWIRLAGRRVTRGTRVDFAVGAENAEGGPIENARFDVAVKTPDGNTLNVRPAKSGDEWGAVFRETQAPGDYVVTVTGREGNDVLGTAEARFLVPDQDLELDRPAAEPSLMAQLAEMTRPAGGAALAAEELPDLLKRLADKPPELKEEVVAKVTYWDTWPFFLLFVGLLGVEWFLRKRWGLV
ncbi:MAG: glutamine amidotransferase [Planctomycetes bacterium]|nr:glutamine amidotransferase [Planctomycetota bacterium]